MSFGCMKINLNFEKKEGSEKNQRKSKNVCRKSLTLGFALIYHFRYLSQD